MTYGLRKGWYDSSMVRGGEYFKVDIKVDIKVGIKMDYRVREYLNKLKVGRLDQRELSSSGTGQVRVR